MLLNDDWTSTKPTTNMSLENYIAHPTMSITFKQCTKTKKRQGDNNNNRIYYFLCKVFNIATRFKCLTLAQTLQTCIKYIEVGWSKFCLLVTVMLIWTFQMRYQFVFISCDYRAAWRRKSPAVIEIKDMPNSCRLSSNKKKEIF